MNFLQTPLILRRTGDMHMKNVATAERCLLTLGQLAERVGVSTHRLKYAIDQYHVEPRMRIGITRVWSEDSIPLVKSALARIASNRRGCLQ